MKRSAIIGELPDVFELEIALPFGLFVADSATVADGRAASDRVVEGSFLVTVDKGATSAQTRFVEPGTYTVETAEGSRSLTIEKFSISPFGAVATISTEDLGHSNYFFPFLVTDDKGNTANFQVRGQPGKETGYWFGPEGSIDSYTVELVGLDPQAESFTITPIVYDEALFPDYETRTFDATQTGLQVPLSAIGGITVVSHEVADGRITTKVKPYGYIGPSTGELFNPVIDDSLLYESLAEVPPDGLLGSRVQYYDRGEDVIVIATDCPAVSSELLAQLANYHFFYDKALLLDEGTPLTLPLNRS
jgi:hypothetical protein